MRTHLDDAAPEVRATAAWALWKITGETNVAVPLLISMVESQTNHVMAMQYLGDMGTAAMAALPTLMAAARLDGRFQIQRIRAAEAFLQIDGRSEASAKLLTELLETVENPADVRAVAKLLALLGPRARPALPVLERLKEQYSRSPSTYGECALAIRSIQRE